MVTSMSHSHHVQELGQNLLSPNAVSLILPRSDFIEMLYTHNTSVLLVLLFYHFDSTLQFSGSMTRVCHHRAHLFIHCKMGSKDDRYFREMMSSFNTEFFLCIYDTINIVLGISVNAILSH